MADAKDPDGIFKPVLTLRAAPTGAKRAWSRGLDVYDNAGTWLGPLVAYELVGEDTDVQITIRLPKCRVTTLDPKPEPGA